MLTSNLYPSFSNNGFAASNISACGVGDAPILIVLSSLLPDEQPVNNPTANVILIILLLIFLTSF